MSARRSWRRFAACVLFAGVACLAQAADNGVLSVSAVVPSKNNCKFSAGALTLNFGAIDPAAAVDATATATMGFRCTGSAPLAMFSISAGNGLHATGPAQRRMRHATLATEYLPYAISLSPTSGTVPKNTNQVLTVTGTIQPSEFQNVPAGSYSDLVVITLTP